MHAEQKRKSGEPYVIHPLNVALIIAQLRLDLPSVITGLLHDVIEDTGASLDEVQGLFGEEVSRETLEIYAPIAHRLGIYWLKSELEDFAFRYLNPSAYATLKAYVAKTRAEREEYIRSVIEILTRRLKESGVEAEVTGRPKHFFSIHSKMQQEELSFDQIYDLVAFRIIVQTLRECYEALGVVHANWKPIPGRFKDYIALPKVN